MGCWIKIKDTKSELITQGTVKSHHIIHCTIDFLHHLPISPLYHFSISPIQHIIISPFHRMCKKYQKSLHHFTLNNIDILQSSYHINTSPFHHFTISPWCYKCEPMQYNKKRAKKQETPKDNSNGPINPYKHIGRY